MDGCGFQMPPDVIPKLLHKIREGYDAAIGSRYVVGGKDLRFMHQDKSVNL